MAFAANVLLWPFKALTCVLAQTKAHLGPQRGDSGGTLKQASIESTVLYRPAVGPGLHRWAGPGSGPDAAQGPFTRKDTRANSKRGNDFQRDGQGTVEGGQPRTEPQRTQPGRCQKEASWGNDVETSRLLGAEGAESISARRPEQEEKSKSPPFPNRPSVSPASEPCPQCLWLSCGQRGQGCGRCGAASPGPHAGTCFHLLHLKSGRT